MKARNIDYATRDYEGFRTALIELLKQKIPQYTDFSQSDAGIVLIELLSHGLDVLSYYEDVVANEVFLPTARERESVIKIANTLGYSLDNAKPAKFMQVFEIQPRDYTFLIPKGFKVSTVKSDVEEEIVFETDQDLFIPQGATGLEKDSEGNYRFQVPITQGSSVKNEVLGTSDGTSDQVFLVANKPVIEDSIEIWINEGEGLRKWNRVQTFLDSNTEKRDYMAEVDESDTTYIKFGNNVSGKIPVPYTNGITINYRIGGGIIGNVAPNTITEMTSVLAGIVRTFNPDVAYEAGTDKETLESAKVKAPRSLRVLNRAVTKEDYKDVALLEKFILQANSIYHEDTGIVDVIALPNTGKGLTHEQVKALQKVYDEKGLLGQKFAIKSANYVGLNLVVNVVVFPIQSNSLTKELVEDRINAMFSLGNYEFGQDVTSSDIIYELMQIVGIKTVSVTGGDVEIGEDSLPEITSLTVTVTGGAD